MSGLGTNTGFAATGLMISVLGMLYFHIGLDVSLRLPDASETHGQSR